MDASLGDKFPEDVDRFYETEMSGKESVGDGGHAHVYKGSFGPHRNVAMKVWKYRSDKKDQVNEVVNLLRHSHHQNIVRFFGIAVSDDPHPETIVGLVTEFMDNGDLSKTIHNEKFVYQPGLDMCWITQAAHAIQYLHLKEIAHRDVKPKNMLLTNNYRTLKLCDFGLCKDYSQRDYSNTTGLIGTSWYIAPEKLDSKGETPCPFAIDMYSLSISVWEIITRKAPYDESNLSQLYMKIIANHRPDINLIAVDDIKTTLLKGWGEEPKERPTIAEFVLLFEEKWRSFHTELSPMLVEEETPKEKVTLQNLLSEIKNLLEDVLLRWKTTFVEINESVERLLFVHTQIMSFRIAGIISEDNESLKKVQDLYTEICQIVMEQFKEFSKKTIEQVWTALTLDTINETREIYNKCYGTIKNSIQNFRKCEFSHNLPFDWRLLYTWSNETLEFVDERKQSLPNSLIFCETCSNLTEDFNNMLSYLEQGAYSEKISDNLVGLVNIFQILDKEQNENRNMFMFYSDGELHDRLTVPRNVMKEIDQRVIEMVDGYKQKLTETGKDLDEYLLFCRRLSTETTIEDDGSLKMLFEDVRAEKKQTWTKWSEAELIGKNLVKWKLDIEADLKLGETLSAVKCNLNELEELETMLCNCVKIMESLNELKASLPTFSLLQKRDKEVSVADFQRQAKMNLHDQLEEVTKLKKEIPPRSPFQLEQYLERKTEEVRKEVTELVDLNEKLSTFVAAQYKE